MLARAAHWPRERVMWQDRPLYRSIAISATHQRMRATLIRPKRKLEPDYEDLQTVHGFLCVHPLESSRKQLRPASLLLCLRLTIISGATFELSRDFLGPGPPSLEGVHVVRWRKTIIFVQRCELTAAAHIEELKNTTPARKISSSIGF